MRLHTTPDLCPQKKCKVGLDKAARHIETMPLAQGCIVSVVLGVSFGSIIFDNINAAVFVTKWLSILMAATMGLFTLWLIHGDNRQERSTIVSALSLLIFTSLLQVGIIDDIPTIHLLNNLSTMMLYFALFMLGIRGYSERRNKQNIQGEKDAHRDSSS
jgi:hypothetical protein